MRPMFPGGYDGKRCQYDAISKDAQYRAGQRRFHVQKPVKPTACKEYISSGRENVVRRPI